MSLSGIHAVVFVVFSIIIVVHARELSPIKSDANIYLTCLRSSTEQLTFDVSSFLEEFTNIVLQTVSKEKGYTEYDELKDLDHALKSYFQKINLKDLKIDGFLEVLQLMSECFKKHSYFSPVFVDIVSSFIYGLKEKAELTQNNSIPSEDRKETNGFLRRHNPPKVTQRSQLAYRKAEPMNVRLSSKPVSGLDNTYNQNNPKREQSYSEKENSLRAVEPTFSVYSLFSSSFFENIATSRSLQRLFNSIMMTTLARKNFFRAFYRASKMFGLPNPEMFASTVALAIGETFHSLSTCSFINIIANSIGQYLCNVKILNKENYFDLAALLADELNKSLRSIPIGSRDVYMIQSLATGIIKFLYSLRRFTPRDAPLFARYMANELLFSRDNASMCRYRTIPRLPTSEAPRKRAPPLLNKASRKRENREFSSILLNLLTTSEEFSKTFELQLSAEDAYEISYDYIYKLAASLGSSHPNDTATKIAEAIGSSLNSVEWYSFASTVAISLEKFLSEHSFLTADNAQTLAGAYLRELNEVVANSTSSSYIDVFFEATHRFLVNKFFLDTGKTDSFGSLLVDEMKLVEPSKPPVSSSELENSFSVAKFLRNNCPVIYSPAGLSSEKASIRVEKITENMALNLSPTAKVNVDLFTRLFLSTASDIYSGNRDLEADDLLVETLLELISALLQIIQYSSIHFVPSISKINLALSKSLMSEIF